MCARGRGARAARSVCLRVGVCVRAVCAVDSRHASQDDLDGLNVLYPSCEHLVSTPQCFKSQRLTGWVRLTVYVGVPTLLVAFVAMACNAAFLRHHRRARRKIEAEHREMAAHVVVMR